MIPEIKPDAKNAARHILVVEDELMISMMIEDTLLEAGYAVVGPYATVAEALNSVRSHHLDAAILDVNLNGQMVFPVAEELAARGVPFGFATGYGKSVAVKPWGDRPVLSKPFSREALEQLVAKLILSRPGNLEQQ